MELLHSDPSLQNTIQFSWDTPSSLLNCSCCCCSSHLTSLLAIVYKCNFHSFISYANQLFFCDSPPIWKSSPWWNLIIRFDCQLCVLWRTLVCCLLQKKKIYFLLIIIILEQSHLCKLRIFNPHAAEKLNNKSPDELLIWIHMEEKDEKNDWH